MTNSSCLRNEEAVLDALAQGMTCAQAAQTAGVVISTVARYMQDPVFTFRLRLRDRTCHLIVQQTQVRRDAN